MATDTPTLKLNPTDRARTMVMARQLGSYSVFTCGAWWTDGDVLLQTPKPFRVNGCWFVNGRSLTPSEQAPRTPAQIAAVLGGDLRTAWLGEEQDHFDPVFTEGPPLRGQKVFLDASRYVWVAPKYLRFLEREGQVTAWGWHTASKDYAHTKEPPVIIGLRGDERVGAVMPIQLGDKRQVIWTVETADASGTLVIS